MTTPDTVAVVPATESEIRWQKWQAQGAEIDRQTAKKIRGLLLVIAVCFIVWAIVQLA
jgi:hypothetical protein